MTGSTTAGLHDSIFISHEGRKGRRMKRSEISAIGPLFMVGLPTTELDSSTLQLIRDLQIHNFIIFKRNVQDKQQLHQLCDELKQACRTNDLPAPLISIDQEGGSVTRLPPPFAQFADARILAESSNPEKELLSYADTCSRELLEAGINMNLAPVLDVCAAGHDYFMERRSLGEDPARVVQLGVLVVNAMQQLGIAACAKHFPGLGAAVIDPHLELPQVTRPLTQLRAIDLPPFAAAIAAGVAAIMTSHTIYHSLDPAMPATLSPKILTGLLRNELGYDGLIITDDLEMGAIEREQPLSAAALQALTAGADLLLICHDHAKVHSAFEAVVVGLEKGILTSAQLQKSITRIAEVRRRFAE
jgi:beta-N-acetylhexosaminidase